MSQDAEPLTLRPSSLDYAPDCYRRWAASALRREIRAAGWELRDRRRGIAAGVGIALHASAKNMLDEKCASGVLPPVSVAEDVAVATVREEIARGVEFEKSVTQTPAVAELQVRLLSRTYWWYVAPRIQPIAVEKRIKVPIPGTRQPLILSGQPDIVAVEVEPDHAVRDTKATAQRGNHNKQIGAYSLLERTLGLEITKGIIDWLQRVRVKKLQPRPEERKLDIALCENMAMDEIHNLDRFITVWREGDPQHEMLPGDPRAFPANPNSKLCREQYCPAHSCGRHGFCQEWRKDLEE